jgi:hypothetical protein
MLEMDALVTHIGNRRHDFAYYRKDNASNHDILQPMQDGTDIGEANPFLPQFVVAFPPDNRHPQHRVA